MEENMINKYLRLVLTDEKKKHTEKVQKNYGTKSDILLVELLITQKIMMKNIRKSNLTLMMIYL